MSPADAAAMHAWARGTCADEAGVELLVASGLAERHALASAWRGDTLDIEALRAAGGVMSGGERRILAIALSLLSGAGRPEELAVDLPEVLANLDRRSLDLVLVAIAHAAGFRQTNRSGSRQP